MESSYSPGFLDSLELWINKFGLVHMIQRFTIEVSTQMTCVSDVTFDFAQFLTVKFLVWKSGAYVALDADTNKIAHMLFLPSLNS